MKKKTLALMAALALSLALLAACGGDSVPTPDPAPSVPEEQAPPTPAGGSIPQPGKGQEAPPAPAAPSGTEAVPEEQEPAAAQPDEPAPELSGPLAAGTEPEPEPEPEPVPEPEPEGENVMAGDTYMISVALEGGTGRATVESPAKLRYEDGKWWATIVWSSANFDYMKVDGQRYDLINTEGNSTFEIPVSAFDQPLPVIANTIAMSEPHEVEYTLTFDSASMQDA